MHAPQRIIEEIGKISGDLPKPVSQRESAEELTQRGLEHQMRGDYSQALNLYHRSIEFYPTAEAYTFMGWTYGFMNKLEAAIACCKKAISVDPTFGNPYNDIGAYLIEMGKPEDAIPWLEQATRASRYECYHFPWFNLGRVYERMNDWEKAKSCYRRSLEAYPDYPCAKSALTRIIASFN